MRRRRGVAGERVQEESLTQAYGRDIVATGSVQLVHALIAAASSTSNGCSSSP
jgi:hypothetical protein